MQSGVAAGPESAACSYPLVRISRTLEVLDTWSAKNTPHINRSFLLLQQLPPSRFQAAHRCETQAGGQVENSMKLPLDLCHARTPPREPVRGQRRVSLAHTLLGGRGTTYSTVGDEEPSHMVVRRRNAADPALRDQPRERCNHRWRSGTGRTFQLPSVSLPAA